MGEYTLIQWLLFFYIYCFLGWCFESTYVSLKKRKFVNRGFMKGPFLPIYGSGAIVVLFVTIPLRGNNILVFLGGALAATILELVTGICMEALFKVRYWDYSNQKFNFMGHICLSSTIAWGFLSIAMVNVLHKPIDHFVMSLNNDVVNIVTFVITIYVAADFSLSFRTAMDLKVLLGKMEGVKNELKMLQKRLEVIEAVAESEANEKKIRKEKEKEAQREARNQKLTDIIEELSARVDSLKNNEKIAKTAQLREELLDMKSKFAINTEKMNNIFSRDTLKMIKRNPGAKSTKYQETFENIKENILRGRKNNSK